MTFFCKADSGSWEMLTFHWFYKVHFKQNMMFCLKFQPLLVSQWFPRFSLTLRNPLRCLWPRLTVERLTWEVDGCGRLLRESVIAVHGNHSQRVRQWSNGGAFQKQHEFKGVCPSLREGQRVLILRCFRDYRQKFAIVWLRLPCTAWYGDTKKQMDLKKKILRLGYFAS